MLNRCLLIALTGVSTSKLMRESRVQPNDMFIYTEHYPRSLFQIA